MTSFSAVYDSFLSKITDDMYMELTREDTEKLLKELFFSALPHFEFPRQNLDDYDATAETFNIDLTEEEINIIAIYMIVEWIGQQLASIENIRMKYTGVDFKMTSQANHIAKLQSLKSKYETEGFHLQRLYKRRIKDDEGVQRTTLSSIMEAVPRGRFLYGNKV